MTRNCIRNTNLKGETASPDTYDPREIFGVRSNAAWSRVSGYVKVIGLYQHSSQSIPTAYFSVANMVTTGYGVKTRGVERAVQLSSRS